MNRIALAPFLLLPVLSSIACAPAGADDADATEGSEAALTATATTKAELGAAVGALVVNGERLCTAALVKASAGATVRVNGREVSAEGRQVVFGGACVGKLTGKHKDFLGAAAFVGIQSGVTVKTPIVGFDFETQAAAGLAVGILAEPSKAERANVLRLNSQGFIGATSEGASCTKIPLLFIGRPCELAPSGGLARGWHNVEVDLRHDIIPNPSKGQLVVFSTADQKL